LERILHPLECILHSLERILHPLERILHPLERILHTLERILHTPEAIVLPDVDAPTAEVTCEDNETFPRHSQFSIPRIVSLCLQGRGAVFLSE
jgi:hypothetical protein